MKKQTKAELQTRITELEGALDTASKHLKEERSEYNAMLDAKSKEARDMRDGMKFLARDRQDLQDEARRLRGKVNALTRVADAAVKYLLGDG